MDIVTERNELSVSVVSGDHERATVLCKLMNELGLRAFAADFTSACDVILFDLPTCRPGLVADLIEYATAKEEDRPLLASLGGHDAEFPVPIGIDVRLSLDSALSLAPARFRFARRIIARKAEARLREASYSRFGVVATADSPGDPRPVLYVGDVSSIFPALQSALGKSGRELTAALSTYTAFDYLHDAPFGAIILDAAAPMINAESFCDMISRSPGLADIPMLVLVDRAQAAGDAILQRASDLMHRHADVELIADQLMHLQQLTAPNTQAFAPPSKKITDPATGLFSRSFFEDHLALQVQWAKNRHQPLSLVLISLTPDENETHLGADLAHTSKIVRSLLRAQDAPCRLDWTRIAVSLPGADRAEAAAAARRICDVMDATAFETGLDRPARQVTINCRIASLTHEMDAADLLKEADRLTLLNKTYAA